MTARLPASTRSGTQGEGRTFYSRLRHHCRRNGRVNSISAVPKKLNITPGDFDEKQLRKLTPILRDYTADYCDPQSTIALLKQIDAAGFVRLAAKMASDHYEKCGKYSDFLELGYYYNDKLGEYQKALEIINRLIELDPASADYRFNRAKTYETMKVFDKALLDQISALDLPR
jgi:tetratricopeptide (TPR) repeat protein